MAHELLVNTSKTPIKHPVTGALIPGGHSYTVPDEKELKAQEKMVQAYEKAKAKEEAKSKEEDKSNDDGRSDGDGKSGDQNNQENTPTGSDA